MKYLVVLFLLLVPVQANAFFDEDIQKNVPFIVSDQMKECVKLKYSSNGKAAFYTGREENFTLSDKYLYRGHCWTASTYSLYKWGRSESLFKYSKEQQDLLEGQVREDMQYLNEKTVYSKDDIAKILGVNSSAFIIK